MLHEFAASSGVVRRFRDAAVAARRMTALAVPAIHSYGLQCILLCHRMPVKRGQVAELVNQPHLGKQRLPQQILEFGS